MFDIIIGRSKEDREKYGTLGAVLLAKHYVRMGQTTSLSNKVYMDITRSHVVFVCGKRGGGKCLTGDALITLNDGREVPIKDLFETYGTKTNSSEDYIKINADLSVKSFDFKKNAIVNKKVTHVYRKKVHEKLITWEFEDKDKKKILLTSTLDHKILGVNNKENQWFTYEDYTYCSKILGCVDGSIVEYDNTFVSKNLLQNFVDFDGYVYDLTVEDTHNFVANNIIVHNSYTLGVIAEGLSDLPKEIKNNLAIVLVDTMGIYWTMKYPNKKEEHLLKDWNMDAKGLDIQIYTPEHFYNEYKKQGIPTDVPFSIATSDLTSSDWCLAFDFDINSPHGVLLDKVVNTVKDSKEIYDIEDFLIELEKDEDSEKFVKASVKNHFLGAKKWGVFSEHGTHINDIVKGGQVTVLDVSCYATMPNGWNIKSLVLGLVSQKLFDQRMLARKDEEFQDIQSKVHYFGSGDEVDKKDPLVWVVVDEAHEFLPREGKTASSQPLITILREGRQPGISLILATQQPAKIHTDVMTQSDTVISHRLTAKIDVDALSALMQSYMRTGLDEELDNLPRVKGSAVIFDDTNEKLYPIRIRPRFTWHGGESPSALTQKKDLDDF
ncbi:MAG: zonular occludens toxin domain-containing protein [Candidatus Woesearchaeota archaeon]